MADTVLKGRLCKPVWQPGQQLSWFSAPWPDFAAEADGLRANKSKTPRRERDWWESEKMGKPKPSACSQAERAVTAKASARYRAAPQKVRGFGELKSRCTTHLLELTK